MIVFISGEDKVKEARSEYKKSIFVNISDEMKVKDAIEGRQFLPPGDILADFIDDGNGGKYQTEYYTYLRDPRVHYMLLLLIYQASSELLFFVYSNAEKDLQYPKFLKNHIVNLLECYNIDTKCVTSYKKFDGKKRKFDKAEIQKIITMISNAKGKAEEAYMVLN